MLKESFGFPDNYGENLDALWDCLDNYCDWELCVYLKGLNMLPKALEAYVSKILEIFERVHLENSNIMFEIVS